MTRGSQDEKATPGTAHTAAERQSPQRGLDKTQGEPPPRRPQGREDREEPSRHRLQDPPGTVVLEGPEPSEGEEGGPGLWTGSACWLITISGPASSPAPPQGQAVLRPQGAPGPRSRDRGVTPARMGKRGLEPSPTPAPSPRLRGHTRPREACLHSPCPTRVRASFVSYVGYFTEHGRGQRPGLRRCGEPPGQSRGPAQQGTASHLAHSTHSPVLAMTKTLNCYTAEAQPIQRGGIVQKEGPGSPGLLVMTPPLTATGTRVWWQRRGLGGLREGPSLTTAGALPCADLGPYTGIAPHTTRDHQSVQSSRSVVSDSLRPHESQHARPPCPSPTPGVHSD